MKIRLVAFIWIAIAGYQTAYSSAYETIGGHLLPSLRFETSGHLYFDEGDQPLMQTLGIQHQGKTSIMRFISEDIHVQIKDPIPDVNKLLFYYKITDRHGFDVTDNAVHLYPDQRKLQAALALKEGIILSTGLSVGDFFLLDFYDRNTDTLLHSYYLIREKMFLEIINDDISGKEIILQPKEEKTLHFARPKGSMEPIHLSYRVENRWGKIIIKGTSKDQITLKSLPAGSDYNLTVWSPFVPEAEFSALFLIQVLPYWYQTNFFYLILIVSIVICLWVVYVRMMRRRMKIAENKRIKTEQKLLSMQAQLNPHFIFNALNSIKGLNSSGQIEKANQYLGTFSKLLRTTLKNSNQISHSLEQELSTLEIYLELEKLRFGFEWTIEVEETIHPSILDIPTLLLQPLVENAVKHGVSTLGADGRVKLRVVSNNVDLLIEIMDNGKGFPAENDYQGFGIHLTQDRIKVFNGLSKTNQILLTFEHQKGTTVKLTFANWLI